MELGSSQIARVVECESLNQLQDGDLLSLNRVTDLAHDFKDQLGVSHILLGLDDSFVHLTLNLA